MKLLNRPSVLATFALFSVPAIVTVGAAETDKAMLKEARICASDREHLGNLG
jgi:hypothetical protein